jgi:hypothetical protein
MCALWCIRNSGLKKSDLWVCGFAGVKGGGERERKRETVIEQVTIIRSSSTRYRE